MLKRFEVENFKNFKDKFVFDLSETKNYEFNKECVKNGIAKESIIYGPNACGKTNLGYALFDITTHLTDDSVDPFYQNCYLNVEKENEFAEFKYVFLFGEVEIEYSYGKKNYNDLIYELLRINGKECCSIDRRISSEAKINFKGTKNLDKNLGENNISPVNSLSLLRYILKNAVLSEKDNASVFFLLFMQYVDLAMLHVSNVSAYTPSSPNNICESLEKDSMLPDLESFLNSMNIPCHLVIKTGAEGKKLYFEFSNGEILDFYNHASIGTKSLVKQFLMLSKFNYLKNFIIKSEQNGKKLVEYLDFFIFIDEFDAFYHYEAAYDFVKMLKNYEMQVVLTTHNTSIMTNDLFRPDCYFMMNTTNIKPLCNCTEKDLRKAHSLEKMFRAKAFNVE